MLSSEDFQHLDPGQAYFSLDYAVVYAMQRPLFIYMPNSQTELAPDLATKVPTTANGGITNGGKTVTVHIEPDVKFAPPINRAVTSSDVKYAIDRLANKNVSNGYFDSYFRTSIVGAAKADGGPISGILTPNKTTIVFHLVQADANTLIQALSLPGSAPVPPEVVGPLDKSAPTKFGVTELTATGPYMIQGEQTGNSITAGFNPEKSLTLVRNPNWSAATYSGGYKPPALIDEIDIQNGGDPNVIGPQVLKASGMAQLDTPSKATVQEAYTRYPSQIMFTSGAGDHYLTLDNSHGRVHQRKHPASGLREPGPVRNHQGKGWSADRIGRARTSSIRVRLASSRPAVMRGQEFHGTSTNPATSSWRRAYMKKAGYPSGKYTGKLTATIVGADNGQDEVAINQLVERDFNELGIKTHLIQVDQSVMYGKYCQVPKEEVDACPSGGWIRDFNDPFSILYPTFSSQVITPTENQNFGQVRDPVLDRLMAKAKATVNPAAFAQAWAKADDRIVDQAEAVPEDFDNQPNIFAADVHEVGDALE